MIEPQVETTTVDFNCPAVSRAVRVSREYKVQVTRSGKFLGRAMASTDCSDKSDCPVSIPGGDAPVYDWDRCVFLHPVQR
ncbi:hypothetical protein RA210_U100032 [Rubrivivax sp. A210]|uniref:hypothetical protein n=1 Tax=Rubrivivax sp. A210 TaxID=2772301 RepID=UPI00191AF104|nr:hypothetical protein [Rubrivivax sp. A210]CAD5369114.1 hypothetical protein RA210_U100032 [Rubrivivax sp. A210]